MRRSTAFLGSIFWGCFLMTVAAAASDSATLPSDNVRYVFKGARRPADSKQMTFGLKAEQVQAIFNLSHGQVNLGDVYYTDHPAHSINSVRRLPGFSGEIHPNVAPPISAQVEPDPELLGQWWIENLQVKPTWELATGKGVTIADCDAGFYWHEADLNSNFLSDLRYDLSDTDNPTVVDDGNYTFHGTAVTAIMVGVLDGKGTNGIAFNSKLVPFQNFNYADNDKLDKEEATAKCVLRAIATNGVNIIVLENQMENGSSEAFVGTRDAVRLAIKAGLIVVGAGGNASVPLDIEAKDDTGSIIVGAIRPNDSAESYSNYGPRVTVGAYGEQLHTLYGPDGRLGNFGGTSGATPQVAATVALMKEALPMLTPAQARQILQDSRTVSEDNQTVGGKLNTLRAVQMAKGSAADSAAWMEQILFRQRLSAILNP